MCVLSIKVPIRKKSGNFFNDPRVYIYIYICLSILARELMVSTCVIQSSSNKMSSSVSNRIKFKQKKVNAYKLNSQAYIGSTDGYKVVIRLCFDPSLKHFSCLATLMSCDTTKQHLWLVGWVLWHINHCRLFNAKSIFMLTVLFQTIQFSKNTQFNCEKHFYFKLFSIFKQF